MQNRDVEGGRERVSAEWVLPKWSYKRYKKNTQVQRLFFVEISMTLRAQNRFKLSKLVIQMQMQNTTIINENTSIIQQRIMPMLERLLLDSETKISLRINPSIQLLHEGMSTILQMFEKIPIHDLSFLIRYL